MDRAPRLAYLVAFGLLAGALMGEVVLRLAFPSYRARFRTYQLVESERGKFTRYDPRLGWAGIPNATGTFEWLDCRHHVRQNRFGWRGPAYEPERAAAPRLAVLGDSFVWGFGVEEDEIFTRVLEKESSAPIEVVNMGVSGYGTDQELLAWRERGYEWRPQRVLLALTTYTDLYDNISADRDGYSKPFFRLGPGGSLTLANVPVRPRSGEWGWKAESQPLLPGQPPLDGRRPSGGCRPAAAGAAPGFVAVDLASIRPGDANALLTPPGGGSSLRLSVVAGSRHAIAAVPVAHVGLESRPSLVRLGLRVDGPIQERGATSRRSGQRRPAMNTLWIVGIAVVVIYLAYNFYARRVDRGVIQSDVKRATPAKMYMDGVDFMPTSKNVLFGYHFKSIAAAGPIVGTITAANLWGWLPALLWLVIGVSFIGWVSDYSAIMVSVRNEGNSLSAISHRVIAPRTRTILFVFIFFYLLLLAGAFVGILAAILSARPDVPFGILILALMGLLAGQMMYRWKMDMILVTVIVVATTLLAMALGPMGQRREANGALVQGPVGAAIVAVNNAVDGITGNEPLFTVQDPTAADPRTPPPGPDGKRPTTPAYDAATGLLRTLPNYLFWALFLFVFSYLGANLPIWRFAQPVNYIGFWVMFITIVLSAVGAVLAPLTGVKDLAGNAIGAFALAPLKDLGLTVVAGKAWQPIWPMLFVTIACGAISGWHALVGSVGTARQLEYETDGLPVGAGSMFGEYSLALLSLIAVSIAGVGGGGGRFAAGVGKLCYAGTFGLLPEVFGTALGFGAFVLIVLTVTQLVFRVMRVTLTEWLGDAIPPVRNMHVSTTISMLLTLALVLSGTWVYLWQMFGASNQLMAALSLLVVTVWLKSDHRNPSYALFPMLFMYVTTIVATAVTARNLYVTIATNPKMSGLPVAGAWAMILVAALLIVAALFIGWDGLKAYQRYGAKPAAPKPVPAQA